MLPPAGHGSHVTTTSVSTALSGRELLRSNGLQVEGPVLWGRPVTGGGPGVFIVELPAPQARVSIDPNAVRDWLERIPELRLDDRRPSVAEIQSRLASFWLPGQAILYIGSSQKSVSTRLNGMYKTPLGERRPQSSGYWLKVLRDLGKARIWWAPSDDPELYEDTLTEQFVKAAGGLPFAVLTSPGGLHREHGITSPLRAEAPSPPARATHVTVVPDADEAAMALASAPVERRRPAAARVPKRPSSGRPSARARKAELAAGPSAIERPVVRRSSKAASITPAEAPTHLTAAGLAAMQVELDELTNQRRPEVISRIKAARELGDLSENADYDAARKEQSFLEGRVQQLERMIKNAVMIETEGTGSVVGLGSTVVISTDRHGREIFTIVGSAEADVAAGRISFTSPIGRALIGRRAGEAVRVQVPAGTLDYTIVEVR